eukprot:scaffold239321_cov20-Tisochrysis_lutea.AAC.1
MRARRLCKLPKKVGPALVAMLGGPIGKGLKVSRSRGTGELAKVLWGRIGILMPCVFVQSKEIGVLIEKERGASTGRF